MECVSRPKYEIGLAAVAVLNDISLRSEKHRAFGVFSLEIFVFEVTLWREAYCHCIFRSEVSAIANFDTPFLDLTRIGI